MSFAIGISIGNYWQNKADGETVNQAFEFTVQTDNAGTSAADQFTIPITSATPYDISTSDGHSITGATGATTLTFSAPGTYTVKITDSCEGWQFNNTGDKLKLLDISNWGVYANTATNSFYGASNMTCSAVDKPTGVHTTLNGAFGRCTLFNGAIGNWDVSTVTNMAFMFDHLFSADGEFNQDISSWDVSNVTTFQRMFTNSKFNQDISSWTIKNAGAVNMNYMFSASSFNQPLNDWDMTAVADMSFMFNDNRVFNQDLNLWNTNGCANMASMFRLNPVFNGDISTWNTSNVTNMSEMFNSCNFNGDISAWNTSNVTNMFAMFRFCPMNSNISGWNVSNVTNMALMFVGAPNFNQPIGSWNVSSVTDFDSTFVNATSFNQDLSAWTFSPSLTNLNYTFQNATSFNNGGQPLTWNISNFTAMNSTFYGASSFNADISSWAGNTISNWNQTFRLSGLNQNINSIITSSATNLSSTFRDASLFNNAGVALNLNTSNVTNMQYMFGTAALVNQISGLDSFEVENVTVGDGFIQSSRALTTANYDALLVSWESKLQALYPGGVGYVNTPTFAFGLSTYTLGSAAETARTSLINTFGWTITDGGGVLTNESYLVASYNFDSNFTDYTGNNPLTPSGTTPPVAGVSGGKVSNCAEFNSSADYTLAADSNDFSFTDGVNDLPFSVSFWANFTSYDASGSGGAWFLSKRDASTNEEYQIMSYQNELAFVLFSGGGNTNFLNARIAYPPPIGSWHHYTFTYDGSATFAGLKIYIDGVSQSLTNNSSGTYTGMINGTQDVNIGSRSWQPSSSSFEGKLDEYHIWKNRELTASEVTDIYNTENAGNSILPGPYLLNNYGGAAAAYSLRDLSSSTTNVVRVRRSSDNTEQDFTSTQVTDGTLTTFVGAGNDGFVTVWYDQSGAGNDITFSPAPAEQAQIVTSGSLNLDNGTPYMLSTGNNFGQVSLASALTSTNGTLFCQYNTNDTGAGCIIAQDGSFYAGIIDSTSGSNAEQGMGTPAYYKNGTIVTPDARNNLYTAYVTNQDVLIGVTNLNLTNYTLINRVYPYSYTVDSFTQIVKMKEWILFDADQSSNRTAIESNINSYYTIY